MYKILYGIRNRYTDYQYLKILFDIILTIYYKYNQTNVMRNFEPVLFEATRTVVMKTNNHCNLKCTYCYEELNQIRKKPSMTIENVEKIFLSLYNYCKKQTIESLNVIWHGGEPMLMGIDFYNNIIKLQEKYQLSFRNLMQTNATKINERWIDFFRDKDFKIGISFDGSPKGNSVHRQNTMSVIKKINMLNQNGIHPSIICVVSDLNYLFIDELFNYLYSIDFEYLDLVPCYENNGKYSLSAEHYIYFYTKAFDRWWNDGCKINIRTFSNIVKMIKGEILHGEYVTCSLTGRCGEIISILPNGDVYFCDCLPKSEIFNIGNIIHKDIYALTKSENYRVLYNINKTLSQDCLRCQFLTICGGGCLTRRINRLHNSNSKDYYCQSRKKLFQHIQEAIGGIFKCSKTGTIPAFTRGPQPQNYKINETASRM